MNITITRRGFLGTLAAGLFTAAEISLDPDKALWLFGRKTIFIPESRLPTDGEMILAMLPEALRILKTNLVFERWVFADFEREWDPVPMGRVIYIRKPPILTPNPPLVLDSGIRNPESRIQE